MGILECNMLKKVLFVGSFFILIGSSVKADIIEGGVPERGIQIAPSKIILNSHPGDLKEFVINVKNYDKEITHRVTVGIEDFYVTNESVKAQFFVPDKNHELIAYDVIDWIDLERDFVLKPGESKNVKVKVKVPADTATGGYYGVIFFQTSEIKTNELNEDKDASIKVKYRVGTLLINAVHGNEPIRVDGRIDNFGAVKKIFWNSPVELFANLYSTGNVHYRASGKMEVQKFGKKFAVVDVGSEVMYPNRTRVFTEAIQTGPWSFGVYRARLNMQSEDGSVVFKKDSQIFYVIPWKTLCIIVVSIVVFVTLMKVFRSKFTIVSNKKKQ